MVSHIITAISSSLVTAGIMKSIAEFFRKEEEKKQAKILERKYCFKYSHKLFWAKTLEGGTIEFWAYAATGHEHEDGYSWYLGKMEHGMITEAEGFYTHAMPWDVTKGAERLFKEAGLN